MDQLSVRTAAAYYRECRRDGIIDAHIEGEADEITDSDTGRNYVVLYGHHGDQPTRVLAVYRAYDSGALRRIRKLAPGLRRELDRHAAVSANAGAAAF